MGKFSLGESKTTVNELLSKSDLFVDESKCGPIINDLGKNLDIMKNSLIKIQNILNQCATSGVVKNSRADTFRGWAKKSKSQAASCEKLKGVMISKYNDDVDKYPLKLLDDRIKELELRISEME